MWLQEYEIMVPLQVQMDLNLEFYMHLQAFHLFALKFFLKSTKILIKGIACLDVKLGFFKRPLYMILNFLSINVVL